MELAKQIPDSLNPGGGVNTESGIAHVGVALCAVGRAPWLRSSLYKIFVYFEAVVHESTIRSFLPPTCIAYLGAILLHDYWTVYDSPADLPFVCYTLYNIGNGNIV